MIKKLVNVLITWLVLYLAGCFVAGSFDLSMWTLAARSFTAFIATIISFVILTAKE